MITTPKTHEEALTLGLYLMLIAPTDEQMWELAPSVEEVAAGVTPETVEKCKADALERAEAHWDEC